MGARIHLSNGATLDTDEAASSVIEKLQSAGDKQLVRLHSKEGAERHVNPTQVVEVLDQP